MCRSPSSTARPTRLSTGPAGGHGASHPGAEHQEIDGMGHDLPRQLYDTFIDAIVKTAEERPHDTDR